MIRLHLDRGDPLSAWRLARDHPAPDSLLSSIAEALGPVEPEIAAGIFRGQVEALILQTGSGAYDAAARKLETLARWMEEGAFAEYVAGLRDRHRRKRRFIERIDGIG